MASEEQLVLDGLTLNDATFALGELDMTPPRERQEWIGGADSEWQALARKPLHENREILATLLIAPQSTTNLAMDKIGLIVDKFRLASQTPAGIDLVWTPADGSRSVTFDCLAGEIVGLPINWEEGWLVKAPTIRLRMVCKPYWYATSETTTSTASSSTPFVTLEVASVPGDIPALGRLIVTDTATQSRRHVEWGLEGQYYNASTSLLVASDDMVTSGFGGSQTTTTGAYDPNAAGNNSITCGLTTATTVVAGTGNLSHVGAFRVKARMQATTDFVQVRFAWQAADGPWTENDWVTLFLGASNWEEHDLGTITVPPVIAGTQRWTGRIEARTTTGTDTLKLNYLELVPTLDGYGKSKVVPTSQAGVVSAWDDFAGITGGSNLNARTPPAGAAWATSGAATDFQGTFTAPTGLGSHAVFRQGASATARFAVFGPSLTDVQVSAKYATEFLSQSNGGGGVIARWTDSSNYLRFTVVESSGAVQVVKRVAGVDTTLASVTDLTANTIPKPFLTLRLTVRATGAILAELIKSTGTVVYTFSVTDSALATAGALASGTQGIIDADPGGAGVRYYDDVSVVTPAAEPIVLYSGRNMQFRHDDTIRQDSTGTYMGPPPSYRGSRFLVPVGTSRVMVKARRTDVETSADANVTDATQIQVAYTPRGLVVPR